MTRIQGIPKSFHILGILAEIELLQAAHSPVIQISKSTCFVMEPAPPGVPMVTAPHGKIKFQLFHGSNLDIDH